MKQQIEKRNPSGPLDYLSLALTTFGVGYIPGAPGTYGSAIAVLIYFVAEWFYAYIGISIFQMEARTETSQAILFATVVVFLVVFILAGIWASGRSESIFGNGDPSQAVVDEVMGQLITFTFIPFGLGWPWILAGFLLFRLFDIWKPYPINLLQDLPGGLGICADDIVAGVYAGICLAAGYAVYLSI